MQKKVVLAKLNHRFLPTGQGFGGMKQSFHFDSAGASP